MLLTLAACSGGSGSSGSDRDGETNSVATGVEFVYSGPAPIDTAFKTEFYDNLVNDDRCGSCHSVGGVGGLAFVNQNDVNDARVNALGIVNLLDPEASAIFAKVAGGHQCWRGASSAQSCAELIESWIRNWSDADSGGIAEVQLLPRRILEPVATKLFPSAYSDTAFNDVGGLHDILETNCGTCHSDTSSVRQAPFFASADEQTAYEAAITKIDLNDETDVLSDARSRLVLRLRDESHNCFGECDVAAQTILDAIVDIVTGIPTPAMLDPALVISTAQVLDTDGIAVSVGGRFEDNIIAKWEFGEGSGTTAVDTSGVSPEIFLNLTGEYEWLGIGGIRFEGGKAQATTEDSLKIFDQLTGVGEYSIEAWITPFNVVQEDASIVSYSGGSSIRNFMLSQSLYNYEAYNRGSATNNSSGGDPALVTDDDDEIAQASLQHVVVTYKANEGRRIYVNGVFTDVDDEQGGGNLNGWNDDFAFVLGNDASGSNPWSGNMRMVAIHNRALNDIQILQNFNVGVGQVYYMLFSVSELIDEEGVCHVGSGASRINYCYIGFEVSQIDSYSYLFNTPFFITLNEGSFPSGFSIRGMRVGINGRLIDRGQAFTAIDTTVTSGTYTSGGQLLADIGTIFAVEAGASTDAFFLAFEDFNGNIGVQTPTPTSSFVYNVDGPQQPDVGLKNFDGINQALSAITTVPTADVYSTFSSIRRSLPAVADFQAYFASHQMAVTQLAIAYCDALVNDAAKRDAFFIGDASPVGFNTPFNFAVAADSVTDAQWMNQVIYPLLEAVSTYDVGDTDFVLSTEPVRDENTDTNYSDDVGPAAELLVLITDTNNLKPYEWNGSAYVSDPDDILDGLARCDDVTTGSPESCSVARTAEVVKAVCATAIGSAAVMMK